MDAALEGRSWDPVNLRTISFAGEVLACSDARAVDLPFSTIAL